MVAWFALDGQPTTNCGSLCSDCSDFVTERRSVACQKGARRVLPRGCDIEIQYGEIRMNKAPYGDTYLRDMAS
jgi:hypothetical protein